MQKAVAATQRELASVRTGKASAALLEPVRVSYYGSEVPLSQAASISVPEARMIVVQPWEKQMTGEISKAILKAELGLNPIVDGNLIRVPIPALNEERRRDMVKLVKRHAEEGKVAVRNIRRDANDHLKKAEKDKTISEDVHHRLSDEIQKLTDEFIAQIDKMVTAKEAEVMEV
ncbi:MAG TPA: ribosome recycling factor [candidate division Zixibacteria bacterium]|jgi:ribosome recycling factor